MKVYIEFSGGQVVDIPAGQTAAQVAASCGITDSALYQEFAESDFDAACYNFPSSFTLSEGVVGFDLPTAKVTASTQAKSGTSTQQQAALVGYTPEVLASQAILPELSRTPEIQVVLEAVNDLNVTLQTNLAAIDAATDINEVNNIVNPPTGILFTGRGGGAVKQLAGFKKSHHSVPDAANATTNAFLGKLCAGELAEGRPPHRVGALTRRG
jgi:hypothetical protein